MNKKTALIKMSEEDVSAYLVFRSDFIKEFGEEPYCGVLFLNGNFYMKY